MAQNWRFVACWANFFAKTPLEGLRWAKYFAVEPMKAPRRANFVAETRLDGPCWASFSRTGSRGILRGELCCAAALAACPGSHLSG